MLRRLGVLVATIIGLVLFVSVFSSVGIGTIIKTFMSARWIWLLPYLFISVLILCTLVLRWQIIIFSQGHDIAFWRLFIVHTCGFATGFLSPVPLSGGEPTKAYFLSRDRITYQQAFSTVIINKSIEETMNVLFSLIGIFLVVLYLAIPQKTVIYAVGSTVGVMVILIVFYERMLKGKGVFHPLFKQLGRVLPRFVRKREHEVIEAEQRVQYFFKYDKHTFTLALVLSAISWIFMFAEYKVLLLTLGYNSPLSVVFLVIAVVAAAYLTPVPAAIGTLEGGQASLFRFSSMKSSDGIALSIIVRTRDLLVAFVGLLYMLNYGLSFRRSK